jgi:hypothetical protein
MFSRLLSFCLSVVFFWSNVLAVHASEANFWSERRQAAQRMFAQLPRVGQVALSIPQSPGFSTSPHATSHKSISTVSWIPTLILPYGSVREIHLSQKSDAPIIIHIQDAHGVEEAQKNISSLIQALSDSPSPLSGAASPTGQGGGEHKRAPLFVGLEGASGSFNLEPYRDWPDAAVTRDVAEYFLKEGKIGGPEFVGLTAPQPPTLWGVEDIPLYLANIQALRQSLKQKSALQKILADLKASADPLKNTFYSPELKEFDRYSQAYQNQKEGLGAYVRYLVHVRCPSPRPFPNLQLLLKALSAEESLDFKQVEKERLELVETLARQLPKQALDLLIQQSFQYRAGQMEYGEYHRFLQSLCRDNKIPLNNFRQLQSYIAYVLLAEEIDRNSLLDELTPLEEQTQDRLTITPEQKRLVAISRRLVLLEKLATQSMIPTDWAAYQTQREGVLRLVADINDLGGQSSVVISPDFLKPFEDFCKNAVKRNTAFVTHLIEQMHQRNASSAVLVAGGFHSDGLTHLMREKGLSYVVVTPKITEVPKGNNYLDVFVRDPLPLEKLFSGEEIFLNHALFTGTTVVPGFEDQEDAFNREFLITQAVEEVRRTDSTNFTTIENRTESRAWHLGSPLDITEISRDAAGNRAAIVLDVTGDKIPEIVHQSIEPGQEMRAAQGLRAPITRRFRSFSTVTDRFQKTWLQRLNVAWNSWRNRLAGNLSLEDQFLHRTIIQLLKDLQHEERVPRTAEESLALLRVVQPALDANVAAIEQLALMGRDTQSVEKEADLWGRLKQALLALYPVDRARAPNDAQDYARTEEALKILVKRILSDPTTIVVITGGPGSGKTWFLKELGKKLRSALPEHSPLKVSVYSADEILNNNSKPNFSERDTIHLIEGVQAFDITKGIPRERILSVGVYAPPALVLKRLQERGDRVDREERIARHPEEYDQWYFQDFSQYALIVMNSPDSSEELARRQSQQMQSPQFVFDWMFDLFGWSKKGRVYQFLAGALGPFLETVALQILLADPLGTGTVMMVVLLISSSVLSLVIAREQGRITNAKFYRRLAAPFYSSGWTMLVACFAPPGSVLGTALMLALAHPDSWMEWFTSTKKNKRQQFFKLLGQRFLGGLAFSGLSQMGRMGTFGLTKLEGFGLSWFLHQTLNLSIINKWGPFREGGFLENWRLFSVGTALENPTVARLMIPQSQTRFENGLIENSSDTDFRPDNPFPMVGLTVRITGDSNKVDVPSVDMVYGELAREIKKLADDDKKEEASRRERGVVQEGPMRPLSIERKIDMDKKEIFMGAIYGDYRFTSFFYQKEAEIFRKLFPGYTVVSHAAGGLESAIEQDRHYDSEITSSSSGRELSTREFIRQVLANPKVRWTVSLKGWVSTLYQEEWENMWVEFLKKGPKKSPKGKLKKLLMKLAGEIPSRPVRWDFPDDRRKLFDSLESQLRITKDQEKNLFYGAVITAYRFFGYLTDKKTEQHYFINLRDYFDGKNTRQKHHLELLLSMIADRVENGSLKSNQLLIGTGAEGEELDEQADQLLYQFGSLEGAHFVATPVDENGLQQLSLAVKAVQDVGGRSLEVISLEGASQKLGTPEVPAGFVLTYKTFRIGEVMQKVLEIIRQVLVYA